MIGGAQTARIEWNSVPTPTVEQIFVVHFRRLYKMVPGLFPPTLLRTRLLFARSTAMWTNGQRRNALR